MITRSKKKQTNPTVLHVEVGKPFHIQLYSNATTGYHWEVKHPKSLELKNTFYIPSQPVSEGSGGDSAYTFVLKSKRPVQIQFSYKRPWEKAAIETKIYKIEPDGKTGVYFPSIKQWKQYREKIWDVLENRYPTLRFEGGEFERLPPGRRYRIASSEYEAFINS